MALSNQQLVEMYRRMVRIRFFEEQVVDLAARGELPGAAHTSIGEEGTVVGACMALRTDDYMVGTHRSHGHPIGKGAPLNRLFAELLGKEAGVNHGKGGSMHLADFTVGSVGETSIVGSGLPVAAGAALGAQVLGQDRVALCFFGDGASNDGAFHEALNLAAVWDLPAVFVCENNGYAVSMPATRAVSVKDNADRARGYDMPDVAVQRVFIIGEDIETSFFGTTAGFLEEFGPKRVRNTPLSEDGFIGAAAGAAMVGARPIVDVTIASFLYVAMDQLVSIVSKATYMYGGQARVPLVIRASMFYGGNNAAQHSDRPHPIFMNMPGFKIIAPSTPADMKGLLKSAVRDDDPVLSFEDGTLWATKGAVPDDGDVLIPLGEAEVKRAGSDVTVVAIAGTVPLALAAAAELEASGVSVEVLDPRTLVPLDTAAILTSVEKTGRLVVADPAHRTCSAASEIAALVAEDGFWSLKPPIQRVTTPASHAVDQRGRRGKHRGDRGDGGPLRPGLGRDPEHRRGLRGAVGCN